jgi:hypothetical protein
LTGEGCAPRRGAEEDKSEEMKEKKKKKLKQKKRQLGIKQKKERIIYTYRFPPSVSFCKHN